MQFQYIPCYGLSATEDAPEDVPVFQYIPCYGLSQKDLRYRKGKTISIHPMLRFIGAVKQQIQSRENISIHPMLRFIGWNACINEILKTFQYIPCYGLSRRMWSGL